MAQFCSRGSSLDFPGDPLTGFLAAEFFLASAANTADVQARFAHVHLFGAAVSTDDLAAIAAGAKTPDAVAEH